jgi:hypothetical protein
MEGSIKGQTEIVSKEAEDDIKNINIAMTINDGSNDAEHKHLFLGKNGSFLLYDLNKLSRLWLEVKHPQI